MTWGLLAFITNYIPYVGFWLAVLPPAVLGLLVGGPRLLVVVIVLYLVVNFVLTRSAGALGRGAAGLAADALGGRTGPGVKGDLQE